ncbi:FtsX-like permease family protein [Nonomuraea longicatena]|uniref:ABC3 transporter permease C-terminal domain-containing protein n=1 Tax=Nonomuraea longicatena TaxID=83682 RepID=A0ABN1QU65_9ACTN
MIRLVGAQLRHRAGRVLVLLLGIMVAATGFSVLTGTAETQRLEITGTVKDNYRAQYDILVRPKGSTTAVERSTGLVRANYLSGIHGGITHAQLAAIRRLDGIEVAAPIGMVGYFTGSGVVQVPVTDTLAPGERTMLRIDRTRVADRGLTRIPRSPHYEYVTRRPMTFAMEDGGELLDLTTERLASGKEINLGTSLAWPEKKDLFDPGPTVGAWSTHSGRGQDAPGQWGKGDTKKGEAVVRLSQDFPLLLAAVDPAAEARLAGLDKAVVAGDYFGTGAEVKKWHIPLLATSRPLMDQREEIDIRRLPTTAADLVADGTPAAKVRDYLGKAKNTRIRKVTIEPQSFYEDLLDTWTTQGTEAAAGMFAPLTQYWTAGPVDYDRAADGTLTPRKVKNDPEVWRDKAAWHSAPLGAVDTQFRKLTARPLITDLDGTHGLGGPLLFSLQGRFDATRLPGFSELAQVPMETYHPPTVTAADARTRDLLGGKDLLPTDNVAGYLQAPPLLLTDLGGLDKIANRDRSGELARAPLSVVRIRVTGVTGPDPVSRERIAQVAREIVAATGLEVDITMGASPTAVAVALPAGSHGRPPLALAEGWVGKGVAYRILDAADRKSVVLFVLILAVCAMFVLNAASAMVRTRRSELGVLSCLGWGRGRLFGSVLWEVGAVGLVAGLLSAALAVPLSSWSGLEVSPARALLAVPAALALALAAGAVPAWRASAVPPVEAVRPGARPPRRAASPRGVTGLALAHLVRVPGRTLLGAATLAVCVFALTVLLAVTYGFQGRVIGSLLGDAIVLQARPADYVAITIMFALGALAVADVLYLGIRERDAELAALRATGWRARSVLRLVLTEGAGIGLLGGLAGAVAGLAAAFALADGLPRVAVIGAAAAAGAAVVLAVVSSAVPATVAGRLRIAVALTRD